MHPSYVGHFSDSEGSFLGKAWTFVKIIVVDGKILMHKTFLITQGRINKKLENRFGNIQIPIDLWITKLLLSIRLFHHAIISLI